MIEGYFSLIISKGLGSLGSRASLLYKAYRRDGLRFQYQIHKSYVKGHSPLVMASLANVPE